MMERVNMAMAVDVNPVIMSHSLAFCLHGTSQQDSDLYVMINAYSEKLDFVIQKGQAAEWWRVVDTSMSSPEDFCEPGRERRLLSSSYAAQPRSVVVLSRKRSS